MSTKEETIKSKAFEFCQSFMGKCFNPGSEEGKAGKFDFNSCEQMIKQFCGAKDVKFDFEACQSKMEQFCKGKNEKSNNEKNN